MNIPTKDGWLLIYPCDISYIRSDDIYAYLHNGTEKYFVNISLKDIEEVLDSSLFLRCHRSYIINLNKVKRIIKNQNCVLVMENGDEVPVARGRKEEVTRILLTPKHIQ